jgi:hypothetical protein
MSSSNQGNSEINWIITLHVTPYKVAIHVANYLPKDHFFGIKQL